MDRASTRRRAAATSAVLLSRRRHSHGRGPRSRPLRRRWRGAGPAEYFGIDPEMLTDIDPALLEAVGAPSPFDGGGMPDPDVIVGAVQRGDVDAVRAAQAEDFVFATERHEAFAKALGLPLAAVGGDTSTSHEMRRTTTGHRHQDRRTVPTDLYRGSTCEGIGCDGTAELPICSPSRPRTWRCACHRSRRPNPQVEPNERATIAVDDLGGVDQTSWTRRFPMQPSHRGPSNRGTATTASRQPCSAVPSSRGSRAAARAADSSEGPGSQPHTSFATSTMSRSLATSSS